MMIDHAKVRRENLRWLILLTLNNARPIGASEEVVLSTAQAVFKDATQIEIRRELDYLNDRDLVEVKREPSGRWFADLRRYGVDVVEYTVDCDPGVARPEKYW